MPAKTTDTPSPLPPPTPSPSVETHMAPHPVTGEMVPMAGPAPPPVAQAPAPVSSIVTRKTIGAGSMVLPRVNTRASHAYFRRVFQQLRSIGQYRR